MTARQRRMLGVGLVLAGAVVATLLAARAFQDNILYFYTPSEVAAGAAPLARTFRVGGLVRAGSLQRDPGSLTVEFVVTDNASDVPIRYTGLLPDLFREGQGIIARGRLGDDGSFTAEEVLAKHDENYMPPEVAEALQAAGHPITVPEEGE